MISLLWTWVQFLVEELRSCKLQKKKKKAGCWPHAPDSFVFAHTVLQKLLFLFVVKHLVCWARREDVGLGRFTGSGDRQDTCPVTF